MQTKTLQHSKARAYTILMDDEAWALHATIIADFGQRGIPTPGGFSSVNLKKFGYGALSNQVGFCLLEELCDEYETRMGLDVVKDSTELPLANEAEEEGTQ